MLHSLIKYIDINSYCWWHAICIGVWFSLFGSSGLTSWCTKNFITFNLLLSNENDFEGGGTYFDDGLNLFLEQGDLLIHSGKVKHCGLPIKKGFRYLLVGFINIKLIV